ncbi:GH25 family lysozyme [Brevibacterium album]|uniref:GH25 family lysozyme n=1 Tax=Brevibacterium album TaxID=417948 RepID=UPI000428E0DD|nr:GH25 family lysozyme [Brevibacterium album]
MTGTPSRRPLRARLIRTGAGATAALTLLCVLGALVFTGVVWPNRWFVPQDSAVGVDVSAHQGRIDWDVLTRTPVQGRDDTIAFAFLKATEGSSHVDAQFAANWAGARSQDIAVGAYHFMSFESPGETQAQNVIDTVPAEPGTLVPTVDLEFYGDHFDDPPTAEEVHGILDPLLSRLEEHYGAPPLLYLTREAYDLYIADLYPDHPIWFRSITLPPRLSDGRNWTLWQYSHRDRLDGYDGRERYIDLNVLHGGAELLAALTLGD